ncbi:SDR family NAD(P)-dependent oxidoreductase [Aquiflexum sp. LQ15W]|uniref:SDR family NAD(P)-dependent oxidoreductase n=1 Tax=Cognataquiflexum nitidum TaxID=2922272 RepID=UPI001F12F555|nr:SDR family NAD(P)-dependent oxidoreductase [Cognataquiflexum nitidum]MCH6199576.1 SDR family NAD(P)-dependent oxidoreductase [Cognataquiflexum nitidum]
MSIKIFQNQVIWITGASSGLGKYMALEFAKQGAKLALSARRVDKLEEVILQIKALGVEGILVPCDVLEESEIEKAVQKVISQFGRLDVAIANAGYGVFGKIEDLSAKEWRRQMDGNVTGLAITAKAAIPYLKASKGRLVLIGSVAAYVPNPKTGAYGASKAAVRSIGQTLQLELKGTGVSCTVIHPGFVDSDITRVDNDGVFHPEVKDPRPKNLMWPTDKAARVMVSAISRRKKSYVFTGHGKLIAFIGQHFPNLGEWVIGKMGN